MFGIYEVTTTGILVECVSRSEHGYFVNRPDAEERAKALGETFAVEDVVGNVAASAPLAPTKPSRALNTGAVILI